MKFQNCKILPLLAIILPGLLQGAVSPVGECAVFEEIDGLIAVEAEHFYKQEDTDVRAWYPVALDNVPVAGRDGDGPHLADASGAAYLEILPDTRHGREDSLVHGENFSDFPTPMATLFYKVHINNPGRYYVWARLYSTNTDDNGLHVGIDGEWPASGTRMQWIEKNKWYWDSKQRTEEVHAGERYKIYLDIEEAGEHTIMFSMREDGTEFDKWLMTLDREFERPMDEGPDPVLKSGELPANRPVPLYGELDGNGDVVISGELKRWHKVTLDLNGPYAEESGEIVNPFTDYRMTVTFRHKSGNPIYHVPGYFAADGDAGETSATSGSVWRAHLSPDKTGDWSYEIHFVKGALAAVEESRGLPLPLYDGQSGTFTVEDSDKAAPDLRATGRLEYVNERYLRFKGSGEYFLKAGPDAPETFLAYVDFDNTHGTLEKAPLKTWEPHLGDWKKGDPTWQGDKGKGMIGALNYLASEGLNSFSFLPYNAGGDGVNVWPFVTMVDKLHYDVSKLEQWAIVMEHGQKLGLHLHFKLQENEMDDNRHRSAGTDHGGIIPEALDGGLLGTERKLYLRELIARFGHNLALNWNLGEENTQSYEEQRDMAAYIKNVDPYDHNIVIHTYPNRQDEIYPNLLGAQSVLTGASLQNSWKAVHSLTHKWVRASELAGKPWVVANDEQNPADGGVPPDPGYKGFDGQADDKGKPYTIDYIRKYTLWGNLMAGGAGVEYYFGYKYAESDLNLEDFRSRDLSWDYCRLALEFFKDEEIPFWKMKCRDDLIGNPENTNSKYCLAREGSIYLVYLPDGKTSKLDLSGANGKFDVRWFNPRTGGKLRKGSVDTVSGGASVSLGDAPADAGEDWLVVVRP